MVVGNIIDTRSECKCVRNAFLGSFSLIDAILVFFAFQGAHSRTRTAMTRRALGKPTIL